MLLLALIPVAALAGDNTIEDPSLLEELAAISPLLVGLFTMAVITPTPSPSPALSLVAPIAAFVGLVGLLWLLITRTITPSRTRDLGYLSACGIAIVSAAAVHALTNSSAAESMAYGAAVVLAAGIAWLFRKGDAKAPEPMFPIVSQAPRVQHEEGEDVLTEAVNVCHLSNVDVVDESATQGTLAVVAVDGSKSLRIVLRTVGRTGGVPRILVIDDQEEFLDMVYWTLISGGKYKVETALGGYEGLLNIGIFRPDLVMLDVNMPDPDGLKVCRMVKSDPQTSSIKILAVSGEANSDTECELTAAGADAFLEKLVMVQNPGLLHTVILRLLRSAQ